MKWLFLCVLGHILLGMTDGRKCYLSDCECKRRKIMCKDTSVSVPVFTVSERQLVAKIEITDKQSIMLEDICHKFPTLDILVYTSTVCPSKQIHCAEIECR